MFWDWVGGRYSLWSSIGLPIALAVGYGHFEQMLDGAHEMDEHFRTAPLEQNVPIVLGLLGVWYASVLGATSHAVLPYEQHLQRLPAYLQQLDMESNGKRVDRDGRPVDGRPHRSSGASRAPTGSTRSTSCCTRARAGLRPISWSAFESHDPLGDHHRLLVANCIAQTEALMRGKTEDEVRAELAAQGLSGEDHRPAGAAQGVPRQPSRRRRSSIASSDPRTLGMLLAMYEHHVFTMGAIWNINSFDQWGVELGKQLATAIEKDLAAGRSRRAVTTGRRIG